MTRNCYNVMRKYANIDKEDDSTLTSSVNALSALSTLSGTGLVAAGMGSGSSDAKLAGGVLAGAGLTSAALYHLARVLKAKKLTRALMWGAGAIGGGIAGGNLAGSLDTSQMPMRNVRVTIDGMPQVEVGQRAGDRWNLGRLYGDMDVREDGKK